MLTQRCQEGAIGKLILRGSRFDELVDERILINAPYST